MLQIGAWYSFDLTYQQNKNKDLTSFTIKSAEQYEYE